MVSIGIELKKEKYKETPLYIRYLHNNRFLETKNTIFKNKNIVKELVKFKNITDTKEYFYNEENFLKNLIKEKTKQKSKIENLIVESQIVLSDDEELKGLSDKDIVLKIENYIKMLEEKYKIKVYQYRYHKDEGHFEDETEKINNHIHIIHSNVMLDNGKSFTKQIYKESKRGLSKLQDLISQTFEMKRGIENSENSHIEIRTYKKIKEKEAKENLKTIQELNNKIKELELENEEIQNTKILIEKTTKKIYIKYNELKTKYDKEKLMETIKTSYKENKNNITSNENLNNNEKKQLHKINKEFKDSIKNIEDKNRFDFKDIIKLKKISEEIQKLLGGDGGSFNPISSSNSGPSLF